MADGPDTDLWPGGHAPDHQELLQYLVHTVGLDNEAARQVASRYHPPELGGWGGSSDVNWTESKLRTWLYAQPEVSRVASGRGAGGLAAAALTGGDVAAAVRDSEDMRVAEAAQIADQSVAQARQQRDRYFGYGNAVGFDAGAPFDPGALAQSLAIGIFTDAAGNPVVDPETGAPKEVNAQTLWDAIRGQTFDMGSLSLPRAAPRTRGPQGRRGEEQDVRRARLEGVAAERRSFVTPSMALALLGSMPADYLTHLQQQLWEAGLFGDAAPHWGHADDATRKAYMGLFAEAAQSPDEPIDQVLARLTDEAVTRGTAGGGKPGENIKPFQATGVISAASAAQLIDQTAQSLLGRNATAAERKAVTAQLRSGQIESQRQAYESDLAASTGGPGPGGLDAFMRAIGGQESGGNYGATNPSGASGKYQIMPGNWGPWAEAAGIGRDAPKTPTNQETVARYIMSQYYQRFGNWRDVAIAWYAGPGAVGGSKGNASQGDYPTINQYADQVMSRMAAGGGTTPSTGAGEMAPIDQYDPAAEAEAILKAKDPAGWLGHAFAQQATQFYSLLQGVV